LIDRRVHASLICCVHARFFVRSVRGRTHGNGTEFPFIGGCASTPMRALRLVRCASDWFARRSSFVSNETRACRGTSERSQLFRKESVQLTQARSSTVPAEPRHASHAQRPPLSRGTASVTMISRRPSSGTSSIEGVRPCNPTVRLRHLQLLPRSGAGNFLALPQRSSHRPAPHRRAQRQSRRPLLEARG
jgi:hypothetical protein